MSFKNTHFCPMIKQRRIEAKIKRYIDAIQDNRLKVRITNAPQNQKTLDMLEREFAKIIENIEGDTDQEKWAKIAQGTKIAQSMLNKAKEDEENTCIDD